jgi:homocysteine S-methyltransferase
VERYISEFEPGEQVRTLSSFWKKLQTGEKPFIVELDPPFDIDISKVQSGARMLKEHDVDLLTLSDSPLGRTRMDSLQLAAKLQHEVEIQVMPHVTCRDRNIIALRSHMLGSYMNDIRHYLIVTGDPVPVQDRSTVTAVFDYNSIHFMHLIKEMNHEIFKEDTVVYGGALNYHGLNADAIVRRMKQKMQEGCGYFLTQPIYSEEDIERIQYLKEQTGAKICCGIMPLVSYKNAYFIANEMPGIRVPKEIVDAYKEDMTREESEAIAVEISLSIARKLYSIADGFYFMTPFNRVSLICRIIDRIREEL